MDTRIEVDLLDRYFAGTCTVQERGDVERWLAADPSRSVAAIRMRSIDGYPLDLGDPDIVWNRVFQRIHGTADVELSTGHSVSARQSAVPRYSPRSGSKGQLLRRRGWSATAALALCVIVVVTWIAGGWHISHNAAASSLAYSTGNGERATITLPDGGTVALNVASRLEVPLDYMAGNRTVRLVGEGLFTVQHHDRSPFTVIAGSTTAKVLGTSFVVRRYATETKTVVAVKEGRVAIGDAVLAANRLAEVGSDRVPHIRPADASLFSFATGVLTLGNMSLHSAIVELDRWYDVDIRLGDTALMTQPLKGEFAAGSVADLVGILEWTFKVRVVRDGRVLTLYPRR